MKLLRILQNHNLRPDLISGLIVFQQPQRESDLPARLKDGVVMTMLGMNRNAGRTREGE